MGAISRRGTTPISHDLTTTGFELPGLVTIETLGIVRGIVVRSRSVFGMIGAKIETLFGGNISLLTTLCERAREDAFDVMLAHAQNIGANGVVGVRYDTAEIMTGVTEVLCYGTAVVVEEPQN
ncbi:MAG TPA: YbjQ family protein [Gemmatimonadales bacterium]|jgi:uncharacterized protein YbjQ (UPF0145 family)|nr:YbjQ family protein [Gemmatimonadales bacterium]